jgi:hypothetical protein
MLEVLSGMIERFSFSYFYQNKKLNQGCDDHESYPLYNLEPCSTNVLGLTLKCLFWILMLFSDVYVYLTLCQ